MEKLRLKLDNWVFEKLAEPFPVEQVKWLPAFGIKAADKPTPVLAYVDARTVVDRLNTVVGAENWSDSYRPVTVTNTNMLSPKSNDYKSATLEQQQGGFDINYGGVECSLTILGVTKVDTGVPSFTDQLKGAYSDSLKRAAVKFGVGEYFYRLGTQFAKYADTYGKLKEAPKLPSWAQPRSGASPDSVIEKLISDVRASDLPTDKRLQAESIIANVQVMGYYSPAAPLVVKRAVYEALSDLMKEY